MAGEFRRAAEVSRIVERQMRNWELARQQSAAEHAEERPGVKFYITLSREMGCRGEAIAQCLSQRLGWKCFDREILDHMAGEVRTRRRLLAMLDEWQKGWMDDVLQPLVPEGMVGRSDYFNALTRAVLTICHYEHAIIVGRGANFVLPPDQGLRVRLVAPLPYRIAAVARAEGLDEGEAKKRIDQIEGRRAKFVAAHYGRFPYDPRNYDVVLNTASFSDEQACELIVAAARSKPASENVSL